MRPNLNMKVMEALDSDVEGSNPRCATCWQQPWGLSFLGCKTGIRVLIGVTPDIAWSDTLKMALHRQNVKSGTDPRGSPLTTLCFFPRSPCFPLR